MLPPIHAISFSRFRANAAAELNFVTKDGGNLWLTRHRKPVCAVVSMRDAHQLAALQGRGLPELLHRLAVDTARLRKAKALQARYELAGTAWVYPGMGTPEEDW